MSSHNILLLGSGGRECALARKLAESPLCDHLFIAPGNAGTHEYGKNIALSVMDFDAIKAFCIEHHITILVPGPEDPLVAGLWDYFKHDEALKHIIVVGPSKAGAQLEGSKAFSKKFMQRHKIPTAAYREFDGSSFEEGVAYLRAHSLPVVIKADGLAAGKGVIIAQSHDEAVVAFTAMIKNAQFGAAGSRVVVEAFLEGIELSVFAFTDGRSYVLLPEAKDYKRIGEGDTGLNTGGMGAISPVPFADADFMLKVNEHIVAPTINGLAQEGITYQGFVFFGLIKVGDEPFVIEYNCRMGDPETEVVIPRLQSDLIAMIVAMHKGNLAGYEVIFSDKAACTVMLVSAGYPGDYQKGKLITGLDQAEGSLVFHAGTKNEGGAVYSNGGRVIAVTSLDHTLEDALATSYRNAEIIDFEGKYYRRDIGYEFKS